MQSIQPKNVLVPIGISFIQAWFQIRMAGSNSKYDQNVQTDYHKFS